MAARKATSSTKRKSPPKKKAASRVAKRKSPATRKPPLREPADGPYALHEVVALSIGAVCIMYFLALISYSPFDLPTWVPFSALSDQNETAGNFIGPVGAVTAGYSYFFFGAASFLIPAVLAWWAWQVITGSRPFTMRNFLAFTILVCSATCLIEYQHFFSSEWAVRYNLPRSAGGISGYWLGRKMIGRAMGPVGSLIVVSIFYLIALIVITGIHPFQFARMVKRGIAERRAAGKSEGRTFLSSLSRFFTGRSLRSLRGVESPTAASPAKAPKKKEKPAPAMVEQELPLDAPDVPERKIIDASQRKTARGKNGAREDLFPDGRKNENAALLSGGHFKHYKLPSLKLLAYGEEDEENQTDEALLIDLQNNIVNTLGTFGVDVRPGDITKGPTITRYEVYPAPGMRVNRITSLQADLARATRAEKINILAPVPGKDTVGIEIANSNRVAVALRELFEDDAFRKSKAKLPLALGKDVYGRTIVGDLAKMPHLLVAGATGSGKSVCINSIIASLLYRFTPDELRFIMIDPKVVEMQLYNDLPHMVVPVVTDPKKVLLALRWVINEMERRYALFAKMGTRNFDGFNSMQAKKREEEAAKALEQPELNLEPEPAVEPELAAHFVKISDELEAETGFPDESATANATDKALRGTKPAGEGSSNDDEDIPESLPYIVVIIDELADLMQTAPADVESGIARIAQKARAAGIHLIVATQTPRADVVTGIIKANIPSRVAFQVSSKTDSRIILDENGAENLVGKGDMLYLPPGSAQLIRAQGALITDEEAQKLVEACGSQGGPRFETDAHEQIERGSLESNEEDISDADEELLEKCLDVVYTEKKASTSLLQRRLRLGYTRAARMIDIMESRGIIGPGDGAKPRKILVDLSDDFD